MAHFSLSSVTIVQSIDHFWAPKRFGLLAIVPEQTTTVSGEVEAVYEGCGEIKLCYGIPEGCVNSRDCNLFGAVTHDSGIFDFELMSIRKLLNLLNSKFA